MATNPLPVGHPILATKAPLGPHRLKTAEKTQNETFSKSSLKKLALFVFSIFDLFGGTRADLGPKLSKCHIGGSQRIANSRFWARSPPESGGKVPDPTLFGILNIRRLRPEPSWPPSGGFWAATGGISKKYEIPPAVSQKQVLEIKSRFFGNGPKSKLPHPPNRSERFSNAN